MKYGHLSDYFDGVAFKILSAVEVDTSVSHQHEINGVGNLVKILGIPKDNDRYEASFLYMTDDSDFAEAEPGTLTWYDARKKARVERGVMRTEYRLYFSPNTPFQLANEGDLLFVAKLKDSDRILVIVAEKDTTISSQLQWLFGFGDPTKKFTVRSETEFKENPLNLAASFILNEIGIEPDIKDENYLEEMLELFNGQFPTTTVFSSYARSKVLDVDARVDPDLALVNFQEQEEILYRTLESHLLKTKIKALLPEIEKGDKVEPIIDVILSTLNRRKARAGSAFENHLEYIFHQNNLTYSRCQITENKSKPDFIFPDIASYRNPDFPAVKLTMLGVKTTCKDRWRQILAEADRIKKKHLITLEPRISVFQTEEMRQHDVELVIPKSIQPTYQDNQRPYLLSLEDFLSVVKDRQR